MAQTPVTLRRTPVALATALVLIAGTLAYGLNAASAVSAVRKFSATLQSPACIKAGTSGTFVATFKNDSTSNQPLGSAKIDSDDNATSFTGIANIAITSVPTGKTWTAGPDHANPDGVILKATSSSSALSPGQSVSVTFTAVAPSTSGITKTWKTFAWQTTSYFTSFTRTSPYPTTFVSATCVGPPAYVTFTDAGQPTDTLVTDADHGTNPIKGQGGGGVEVRVEDSNHNPISGVDVTMTIGTSFATGGHLGGDPTVSTVDGIATFSDLTIDLSSSGYRLHAEAGGVGTDPESAEFAITSTDNGCTNCVADLPNGGTVSAPAGTTLIVENNTVVDCGAAFVGFAGTVTIVPDSGAGDIQVTFDDPAGSPEPTPQVNKTYPFCKGGTGGDITLDWGGTPSHPSTADRCSSTGNVAPCIVSQAFIVGPLNLVTKLLINSDDPPVRH